MTCPYSRHDGAYLLGALSPDERRSYEEHLGSCQTCSAALSEVAGLPALLAHLPAEAIEPAEPPPADLLPALLAAVAAERRRSRRRLLVGAALGTAAAVVVTALLGQAVFSQPARPAPPAPVAATPTGPTAGKPVAMTRMADVPIRATAALTDKPWGTQVDLRCRYSGRPYAAGSYVLVAIGRTGHSEQVAAWDVAAGEEAVVTGSTSLHSAELAALEVRTMEGRPVLRLTR